MPLVRSRTFSRAARFSGCCETSFPSSRFTASETIRAWRAWSAPSVLNAQAARWPLFSCRRSESRTRGNTAGFPPRGSRDRAMIFARSSGVSVGPRPPDDVASGLRGGRAGHQLSDTPTGKVIPMPGRGDSQRFQIPPIVTAILLGECRPCGGRCGFSGQGDRQLAADLGQTPRRDYRGSIAREGSIRRPARIATTFRSSWSSLHRGFQVVDALAGKFAQEPQGPGTEP